MAVAKTTKKTTTGTKTSTAKTTTKATTKVEPEVVEEVVAEPVATSTTVAVDADELIKSILNNVNNNNNSENTHAKEYIMCRSVKSGGLNINCKSGNVYEFVKYGADCEIEYHDLAALVRKHSDHLFLPRIVVEDDDFIEEFPQLKKVYENLYTMEDIETILELPVSQMVEEIQKMPKHVYENTKNTVATKIANGNIDSVRRIRALSEVYDSDFNLLGELFAK